MNARKQTIQEAVDRERALRLQRETFGCTLRELAADRSLKIGTAESGTACHDRVRWFARRLGNWKRNRAS